MTDTDQNIHYKVNRKIKLNVTYIYYITNY